MVFLRALDENACMFCKSACSGSPGFLKFFEMLWTLFEVTVHIINFTATSFPRLLPFIAVNCAPNISTLISISMMAVVEGGAPLDDKLQFK